MGETQLEGKALLKRTLVYVAIMVGACTGVIGTLSVVAVVLVGRAVSPPTSEADRGGPALVPTDRVHGIPALGGAPAPNRDSTKAQPRPM
jgi:hypothetical protein